MDTSGGGAAEAGEEPQDIGTGTEPPRDVLKHFQPLPWRITSEEEMLSILQFKHRLRLTPFAKALLELPCMSREEEDTLDSARDTDSERKQRSHCFCLQEQPQREQIRLAQLQDSLLHVSRDEADPDVDVSNNTSVPAASGAKPQEASFGSSTYRSPSAYIRSLERM